VRSQQPTVSEPSFVQLLCLRKMDDASAYRTLQQEGKEYLKSLDKNVLIDIAELMGLTCTRRNVINMLKPYVFLIPCVCTIPAALVAGLLQKWEPLLDVKQQSDIEAKRILIRRFFVSCDSLHIVLVDLFVSLTGAVEVTQL